MSAAPEEIFVQAHGPEDGQRLVLVHGSPDRSGTFAPLIPLLADLHLVTYDRRGFGRSVGAEPPTSLADHANDLIALLEQQSQPCPVVAHSFGANITMLAATRRPDLFTAVGLWEPPTVWIAQWPQSTKDYHKVVAASDDPAAMVAQIYGSMLGADAWAALPAEVRERRCAEGPAFQVDMKSIMTAPFEFADVRVPAVVGYGTETSGGHVEGAIWLAEQLPDAQLHVVPGAGHFANRSHPELYAEFARLVMSRAGDATSTTACRTIP